MEPTSKVHTHTETQTNMGYTGAILDDMKFTSMMELWALV